jgi:hypothetical protein
MFLKITAATQDRSLLKALRALYSELKSLSGDVESAIGEDASLKGLAVWLVDEPPSFVNAERPHKGQQDVFVGHDTADLNLARPSAFRTYLIERAVFGAQNSALSAAEKLQLAEALRSWGSRTSG